VNVTNTPHFSTFELAVIAVGLSAYCGSLAWAFLRHHRAAWIIAVLGLLFLFGFWIENKPMFYRAWYVLVTTRWLNWFWSFAPLIIGLLVLMRDKLRKK
jgi:hypothetical protein